MSRKQVIEKQFPKAVLQALVGLWGRVPEGYEFVSNVSVPPSCPGMKDYWLTFKHEGRTWTVDYSVGKNGGTWAFKHEGALVTCREVPDTEHGEVFTAAGAPVHVTNAGAVARFVAEAKTEHEWPARARNFGNQARLGSMSDAALAHDEAHPYDAYAGYLDPDSGLETEPVLPHAWPPLNKKLSGGLGEQSVDFKAADKRAPRDPVATKRFWHAYGIAKNEIGLDEQGAKDFGDWCVRMGIDAHPAPAAA